MTLSACRRYVMRHCYRVAYRLLRIYWWVARPSARGAYVAVWHADQLLVIRNSYKNTYSLPAGGIDRGESPLAAAVRELREEVGIALCESDLQPVGQFRSVSECKRDVCDVFEWRCDEFPRIQIDDVEVIEARFVSRGEALDLPLNDIVRQYLERPSACGQAAVCSDDVTVSSPPAALGTPAPAS